MTPDQVAAGTVLAVSSVSMYIIAQVLELYIAPRHLIYTALLVAMSFGLAKLFF